MVPVKKKKKKSIRTLSIYIVFVQIDTFCTGGFSVANIVDKLTGVLLILTETIKYG